MVIIGHFLKQHGHALRKSTKSHTHICTPCAGTRETDLESCGTSRGSPMTAEKVLRKRKTFQGCLHLLFLEGSNFWTLQDDKSLTTLSLPVSGLWLWHTCMYHTISDMAKLRHKMSVCVLITV